MPSEILILWNNGPENPYFAAMIDDDAVTMTSADAAKVASFGLYVTNNPRWTEFHLKRPQPLASYLIGTYTTGVSVPISPAAKATYDEVVKKIGGQTAIIPKEKYAVPRPPKPKVP